MPTSSSKARVALAEAIGTFSLIFVAVLSITAGPLVGADELVSLASIAFAQGLIIAVMVAALAATSGGHFNPAITFGFVITGRMSIGMGVLYWIAQLVGAVVAGLLLLLLVGGQATALGTPDLGIGVSFAAGAALEAVCTFFLVFVVFGTAVDERAPRSIFPIAIGLTVALDIMAIGPLTGGAVNPARAFGPALVSGHWANQLAYWIGPLIGGGIAALVHHFGIMEYAPSKPVAEHGGPTPSEERDRGHAA